MGKFNIENTYNKGDPKIGDIINIKKAPEKGFSEYFTIGKENSDKIILTKIFELTEETKIKTEDITNIKVVTYLRNDVNDNFRTIVCIGEKKDFDSKIFNKYIKPEESLITLEKDNQDLLEGDTTNPVLGNLSIQRGTEAQYNFIQKDVYSFISNQFYRILTRGIEDGTFKIPMMIEYIETKKTEK